MAKYDIKSDLKKLFKKHLEGKTSEKEKAFIERYYHFFESEKDILDSLSGEKVTELEDKMLANILSATRKKESTKTIKFIPYKQIAAAVLLALGSYYLYHFLWSDKNHNPIVYAKDKIAEGNENAVTLTLSDGSKLKLEDIQSGNIAEESGVSIVKSVDGTLIYTTVNQASTELAEMKYNTISTPNGQLSQISLPDGTKVWLNAESSLKYPIVFIGKQRVVELKGEGYFEVAKNREKPFIVKAEDTEVKVLGTKFNISAYSNDNFIKTTLAEGLVAIGKEKTSKLLRPNQQAFILKNQADINISNVDIEEAMAWKNGYFMFNNLDIKTVMTMIGRWYDIEVEYKGQIENEVFIGTVSRFDSIEKLLSTLELTGGVHFKIINQPNKKQRKILVMP